jgi:hypothetical protein
MITGVKRIRSWKKYSGHVPSGERVYIGLEIVEEVLPYLKKVGFEPELQIGRAILPSPKLGKVALFNSEGRYESQKDLPMETSYREGYWERTDWQGNTHGGWYDIPYKHYPRKHISPPSEYLVILERGGKKFVVAGDGFVQGEEDETRIIHKVNLLLEVFGRAEILRKDLTSFIVPKLIKVHWELLPPGEMPWPKLQQHLQPLVKNLSERKVPLVLNRFKVLSSHNPDFIVQGVHGYHGYLVFGFSQLNLYVLESPFYGNATYVFEEDWEKLSQLTKAEILSGNLHKHRVVHLTNWEDELGKVFKESSTLQNV